MFIPVAVTHFARCLPLKVPVVVTHFVRCFPVEVPVTFALAVLVFVVIRAAVR